ncbi:MULTISPECIES: polyphosphate kinase 1 [Anaerostipes]|uniref:Polyphosphate kinase n=1 Tax=Anaerostipes butyraticus TaxID=645466 RepID=A0A916Q9E0_9FIRM|nr:MULTISPECIES: polyphosphate kinase 1 [Anaerostipes]GFO86672.1 polyphosphate kinase [Anaerostipes butyraticus]HJC81835.1 polyphosphate kinase 1 [Candidatus Anaerostipes avicola]
MKQKIYMNRELSWLKFNERVLAEAQNPQVPLCERLSFASIYQSNLDEFFMVRVGTLVDQLLIDREIRENKTKMTSQEQLDAIIPEVKRLNRKKDTIYEDLMEKLEHYGMKLVNFQKISKKESEYLRKYFKAEIAPLISPTIIAKRQPFPFLKNKEIYAVAVLETKNGKERLAIIPCGSGVFPRLIKIPGKDAYMLSEEIILHYVPRVFKGYHVKSKCLIRVTRNADIDADALYDEDLDYRDFMEDLIKKRRKLAPIRLEYTREMDGESIETICGYLHLSTDYVFHSRSPLDLSFVDGIRDCLRGESELFYERRVPQKSPQFKDHKSIIKQIEKKDKLLSYPYESMRPFLNLLREAAEDEDVVSIKMTLYRVAKQSQIAAALIEAADNGKEVTILMELKARFDEENNIRWSRRLEDAGCRVIYGLDGYKVHSKLCLITRKTKGGIRCITQIGTGNYNEKTSRLYTDLSLMTADEGIAEDAANVFQALSMGETVQESEHLLVAPNCLQNRILDMIDEEINYAKAGEEAYIGLKMNSLTDKKIMEKLIEASCAGVKIDMIVRGICCLIPGVKGKTENITVRSIVGRFLEHSRIYIFGAKGREKVYIASADFMTRNTLRRVEVAAPVYDPDLKLQIIEMFITMLSDNQKAKEEDSEGNYKRPENQDTPLNSQEFFYQQAYDQAMERKNL